MNILYILTFYGLLQPKGGGQNRFINLTNQMKRKNKMTIMESEEHIHPDDEKLGTVYEYNDVKIFQRALPLSRDFNLNYIRKLFKVFDDENIDVIILSHPSGAIITKLILKVLGKNIPVIYDAHNVESNFTRDIPDWTGF